MDASIIVCTRNRAQSLQRTLERFTGLERPANFSFQFIVVNNGATDHTSAVISSFVGRLPVTEVHQPVPGLSNARNAGIDAAQGDYIIWTDDDALLDDKWLSAYAAAFRCGSHAFFGGKIKPVLESPSPQWFVDCIADLDDLVAARDFGNQAVALTWDRLPYGANFAVKTEIQRQYPYDPELGVGPERHRNGEETAVMRAMLKDGYTGLYVPAAHVLHMIPTSRQTLHYVRQYYRAQGETALLWKAECGGQASVGWMIKQYVSSVAKITFAGAAYFGLSLLGRRQKAVRLLKTFARAIGSFKALAHCRA